MAISVVQSTKFTGASGSFVSNTTAGNCVVVCVADNGATTAATVTAVTLGGSAGNFAQAKSASSSTTQLSAIWVDKNCAGGVKTIAVTISNGSDPIVFIYEISGIDTVSPLDQTAGTTGSSTSWSSGATATTSQASEIFIGTASVHDVGTVTPPGAYTNQAVTAGANAINQAVAGFDIVAATGTATYAGTENLTEKWSAVVITLKAAGAGTNVSISPATIQVPAQAVTPSVTVPISPAIVLVQAQGITPTVITGAVINPAIIHVPALTLTPGITVPISPAVIHVAAQPVTVAIKHKRLIASITNSTGTDPVTSTPYLEGITAYVYNGATEYALQLGSQVFGGNTIPAFFMTNVNNPPFLPPTVSSASTTLSPSGTGLEMQSGAATSGSTNSAVVLEDSTLSGVSGGTVDLIGGQILLNGSQLSIPSGYPYSTDGNTGSSWATGERAFINQLVSGLNDLVSQLQSLGLMA